MWQDKKILVGAAGGVLLTLVAISWPFTALRAQAGPFILRYDTVSGIALTGGWGSLAVIFLTEAAIVAIGLFLAFELYRRAKFLSYMLVAGEAACSVFFVAFAIMLVRLN